MPSGEPRPRASRFALNLLAVALAVLVALEPAAAAAKAHRRHHRPPPAAAVGQPAPGSMNSAAAVACGDKLHCWAVGLGAGATAAVDATTDGGGTWRSQTLPTAVTVLAAVSCVGRRSCLAVGAAGATGAVTTTIDGGQSWILAQDPAGAAALTAVNCFSQRRCLAIATDGTTSWSTLTNDQGQTWNREGDLPAGMTATQAACATSSLCLVVGFTVTGPGTGVGAVARSVDGGATWSAVTLPSGVGILRDVACTESSCLAAGTPSTATTGFVAAGGLLLSSSDGGVTWQIASAGVAHVDAFGVGCPQAKVCVVVGTDWAASTPPQPSAGIVDTVDGGGSWRRATLKYVPVGLSSIACPTYNRCVGAGGNVLVSISLPVKAPKKPSKPNSRAGATGVR